MNERTAGEKLTVTTGRPTFGRLLEYLRGLGFATTDRPDKMVVASEPDSGTVLLFRDRSPDDPVREHELLLARVQLTYRGWVSEADFDRFRSEDNQTAAAGEKPT